MPVFTFHLLQYFTKSSKGCNAEIQRVRLHCSEQQFMMADLDDLEHLLLHCTGSILSWKKSKPYNTSSFWIQATKHRNKYGTQLPKSKKKFKKGQAKAKGTDPERA